MGKNFATAGSEVSGLAGTPSMSTVVSIADMMYRCAWSMLISTFWGGLLYFASKRPEIMIDSRALSVATLSAKRQGIGMAGCVWPVKVILEAKVAAFLGRDGAISGLLRTPVWRSLWDSVIRFQVESGDPF